MNRLPLRARFATHAPLLLILIGFIALALGFSAGPIFEGPDEIEHYRYVRTLRDTGMLPPLAGQMHGQYHQPPLYYLLLLPIAEIFPDSDFARIDGVLNPFYGRQIDRAGNDNTNLYLHTRAEAFPYPSATARAVHVMRLVSIALGAATVGVAYALFGLLWRDGRGRQLAATAVAAFVPQFAYIASVLNNDNLLILLATLSLYLLLREVRRGATGRWALALGVTVGALALTKVSALPLIAALGLYFAVQPRLWRYGALVAGVALAVGGWWYGHNLLVYNDPTGMQALFTTWSGERIGAGIALDIGLSRLPWTYQTAWARFGAGAVAVGVWLTAFFDVVIVLALGGWGLRLARWVRGRQRIERPMLLVVGFGAVWIANVVYYASTAWSGNQGRYLLPGIAAWAALIVLGLEALAPKRLRSLALGTFVSLWAGAAVVCLIGYFLPEYQPLPAPASIEHARSLRYGDTAELIGVSGTVLRARPGEQITMALYWRAQAPSDVPLYGYLHSEDPLVRIDSVPGNGHLLSTDFQPGQTWAEAYTITLPASAAPQRVYPLLAGLYDPATDAVLPASENGAETLPQVATLVVAGEVQTANPTYRLGDRIGLETPQISITADAVTVCLTWDALLDGDSPYKAFIHLTGADGELLAQDDHTPRAGNAEYPTFAWSAGERVEDCTTLPLPAPAEELTLAAGMYDALTNARLPLVDYAGSRQPDDVIRLPLG